MKIPRDLSGEDLVKVLCRDWAYRVVHQEGSHVVLETDIRCTSVSPCPLIAGFVSAR